MKVVSAVILIVACVVAEPPVSNRYLPPQQGYSGQTSLSNSYGVPGAGFARQTSAIFRSPSSSYGAPSRPRRPSTQYGAPRFNQFTPSRQSYQPTTQYQATSSQYEAPALDQAPSVLSAPSTQYGAPSFQGSYSASSQQYGAPGFDRAGISQISRGDHSASSYSGQTRQYLPPSTSRGYSYGGSSYDDGNSGEPANYSFEYMVKDDASGNDFGHRESRQGDRAEGLYYVLLPDGRKQTVEYEADQEGYKPKISYEDTGLGYDRNSQALGYGSGPY